MVSFRFYLITITSIFLALALGIAVGAAVVDRATVDALQSRVENVDRKAEEKDRVNQQLSQDLDRWTEFSDAAEPSMMSGRLAGVPVMMVAVRGSSGSVVEAFAESLTLSGARPVGTVWLEAEWDESTDAVIKKLDEATRQTAALNAEFETTALEAGVAGVTNTAERARGIAVETLVRVLSSTAPIETSLAPFVRAGFVSFDEPGKVVGAVTPTENRPDNTVAAVLADRSARLVLEGVPLSVVAGMNRVGTRQIALEDFVADPDATVQTSPKSVVWVNLIREDGLLAQRVTSVDGLQDFRGRMAGVSAIADIVDDTVGHYGFGEGASGPYPGTQ